MNTKQARGPDLFDAAGVDAPDTKWTGLRLQEEAGMPFDEVTVLSFGAGQDSTALLHRLHYDPTWRAKYAPGRLIVVISDTGDEHPETLLHVERVRAICRERGLEFTHITPDMGYHPKNWRTLMTQLYANDNLLGTGLTRSCTENLKLVPLRRYVADWLSREYGLPNQRERGKFYTGKVFRAYGEATGQRVRILIGITAGEETRMYGTVDGWQGETMVRQYPLAYEGMDRMGCQRYCRERGEFVPPPSHCMRCHFMGPMGLLVLARKYPDKLAEWIEREAAKIAKNAAECTAKGKRNLGVFGEKLIPEMLALAEAGQYGSMSLDELEALSFNRGCSAQRY